MSGKPLQYAQVQKPTYDLIEMDEELLQTIVKEGGALIKSSPFDKSACLVTDAKTFKLKLSETSNSLMVVSDSPAEIFTTKNTFVEVSQSLPKLSQVVKYLSLCKESKTEAEVL